MGKPFHIIPHLGQLRPSHTNCVQEEYQILCDCLDLVSLSNTPDMHSLMGSVFTLQTHEQEDPDALRMWNTKLPTKIKFFD
jgi:hypothetical protein